MNYIGMTLEKAKQQIQQSGKIAKIINNYRQNEPKTLIVTNFYEKSDVVELVVGSFDLLD